jgi:hypothetical protein
MFRVFLLLIRRRYTLPRDTKPITAKITAITSKITAKSFDKPATPPKPSKLAISAITAKIIAHWNIAFSMRCYFQCRFSIELRNF